ncbi:MAG: hypothetical protein KGZ74_14320 [Chitinophagaceae bacterium]|nr:hypothetical protein [Chitinophagaceae bacterium]
MLLYQAVIYSATLDSKDRYNKKIQYETSILWNMVDVAISDSIKQSQDKLNKKIIPSILADIEKQYPEGEKELLKRDLENLSDIKCDNNLIHILYTNVEGKYFNNIKTDSNDIFILTKKNGIIVDPSISTSSRNRPRPIEKEIEDHYNTELSGEAFKVILDQNYQRTHIFRQFYEPENLNEQKITKMRISELEKAFKQSYGDLSVLKSYEFMVPVYIHFDRDILGNKLVNERGVQQDIYQIIIVQTFNISEVVKNNPTLNKIYHSVYTNDIYERHADIISLSKFQQALVFLGSIVIIVLIQFALKAKTKIEYDDNEK